MQRDMILILNFGGSQSHAMARKVRGEQVYCEELPCCASIEEIRAKQPRGLILAGGAGEADGEAACASEIYEMNIPVLAVGSASRRLLAHMGGRSLDMAVSEQTARVDFAPCPLFEGLTFSERYFRRMDNLELPEGWYAMAHAGSVVAAFGCDVRKMYGTQFTAEQNDPDGLTIVANFVRGICGCEPWWNMDAFMEDELERIHEAVGEDEAVMAVSGGVDSNVSAVLMHRAIGERMRCLFVDTGLMRKGERENVRDIFARMGIEIHVVDAEDRFLRRLKGIVSPEEKRSVIVDEFVRVFTEAARRYEKATCLVQGTIYSDIIENRNDFSADSDREGGGFLADIQCQTLLEPVRMLFKDEVRILGEKLGLPREAVYRQSFPGPGLAIRCLGEVTEEKIALLREADAIFCEEIMAAGLDKRIGQYFAVLTDVKPGIRQGGYTLALRAVSSVDAVAAAAFRLPYDLIERVVEKIMASLPAIGRVVYDVTGKPASSIEWE